MDQEPRVILYDSVALVLPEFRTAIVDNKKLEFSYDKYRKSASGKVKLLVTMNNTHSGCLINNRCYPGVHMRSGVPSWTTPFPKPVLNRHPVLPTLFSSGDTEQPVVYGRVVEAAYERLIQDKHLFENDWRNPDQTGVGSGYTQTKSLITDDGAIDAFLDGRLLTSSVGFNSMNLVCSICSHDWIKTRTMCEHRPGETYDKTDPVTEKTAKSLCYMITGKLEYDHYAMVNFPADRHALVVGMEFADSKDSQLFKEREISDLPKADIVALTLMDESRATHLCLTDSGGGVFSISAKTLTELPGSAPDGTAGDGDGSNSNKEGNMDENKPMEPAQKDKDPQPPADAAQNPPAAPPVDTKPDPNPEDKPTEDELGDLMILGSIIDAGIEFDWLAAGISEEQKEKIVERDKKLTTEARKKLPEGVFCGPKRSFPVNDCSHYANAKSRLVHAKAGDKSAIRACIERRGRTLGCNTAKKKGDESVSADPKDEVTRLENELAAYKASLDAKSAEIAILLDAGSEIGERYRKLVAVNILDLRAGLNRPNSKFKDEAAFSVAIDELAEKSLEYLEQTLRDLRVESALMCANNGKIADPTAQKKDGFAPMSDQARRPVTREEKIESDVLKTIR